MENGQRASVQPSDDELVEQCLSGKDSAFREIIERHQGRIYGLALRMMGNRADAEDLAQEAFLRAYSALPAYRQGSFGSWLYRITVNLCLSALRDGRRTTAVDPADLESLSVADPDDPSAERSHAVHEAIRSLDEHYRAVVVLRFMDDLSYDEIAQVLGVSHSAVETRLHRAKKRLRELLKEWM